MTAEKHIKHFKNGNCPEYIYYRCSRKNKRVNCVEPAIRFELLDKQLGTLLLEYAPSDTMLDWLRDRINQDAVESERLQLSARAELQSMITDLERKQSILVDSYLEQDIDRPTFLTKKEQILNEKKTSKDKLVALENSQKCWVEPMNNWLNMLGSICKNVENGDYAKKKELALEIFGLNLFLSNKTLILKGSSGAGGGGENGPRAPFHEAHFRLLSELRSAIKKSRDKRGKFKTSSEMVGDTGVEPVTSSTSKTRSSQLS